MSDVPLPPGIPGLSGASTDPLEAVLGTFPCVRLKNLPFDATLEDILVFFQGLVVLDVLLLGQGEAFVIIANPMDYQMALQRYVLLNGCALVWHLLGRHGAQLTLELISLIPLFWP